MREAFGIRGLHPPGTLLNHPSHIINDGAITPDLLRRQWHEWWDALVRARHDNRPVVSSEIQSHLPLLASKFTELVTLHESDFHRWWASRSGQKLELAHALRNSPRTESELLARYEKPITLTVEVLALDDKYLYAVSPYHVIVSQASRKNDRYRQWLESVVFNEV